MEPIERRRYPRVPTNNLITYVLVDEDGANIGQGIGTAMNVSQDGMLLQTNRPIHSQYLFLVSTDPDDRLIEVVGKVVFSAQQSDDTFRTGIRFKGDHADNVNFRKDLIRVYHQRHVIGIKDRTDKLSEQQLSDEIPF
ncbi:MAG TPA: PilZ domain-containing protein [Desulfobacterales bacterium]